MDDKILEFTRLLRQSGLRVSVAEEIHALQAVSVAGLGDRSTFKDTLRAALVKRGADGPLYDELFDLYFTGLGATIQAAAAALMRDLELGEAHFQELMDNLAALAAQLDLKLSPLAQALLRNDIGHLERHLRAAAAAADLEGMRAPFQEGRYVHAIGEALGLAALEREFDDVRRRLDTAAGLEAGSADLLKRFLNRRLRDLIEIIKEHVRSEFRKRDLNARGDRRLQSLGEKSFYYLSEDEIRRMRAAVTKLAQRLKNIVAVRRRRAKRGKFDVKDTLRRNLQYGGVPFRIQFDRRVRNKPQVVILCDVSDSVRNVSRFMLQFVYSLQDLYTRVRSFIFVSELGEVTRLFAERDINEAIDQALTANIINVFAHSDFGRAFRRFHHEHLAAVNRKTSVLVLGDARNNYNQPHEWALRDIRRRAKQVIWLNPENRLTWGFGDSEMDRYQPYCDIVAECRNLNQLYRVIDRLVE